MTTESRTGTTRRLKRAPGAALGDSSSAHESTWVGAAHVADGNLSSDPSLCTVVACVVLFGCKANRLKTATNVGPRRPNGNRTLRQGGTTLAQAHAGILEALGAHAKVFRSVRLLNTYRLALFFALLSALRLLRAEHPPFRT